MSSNQGKSTQTDNVVDGDFESTNRKMVLSYADAEAQRGTSEPVRAVLREIIRNDELFQIVQSYLVPKGIAGRKSFDQALATQAVINWDVKNGKKLPAFELDHARLWNLLYQVIGQVMHTSRGRLLGYQETPPKATATQGGASV